MRHAPIALALAALALPGRPSAGQSPPPVASRTHGVNLGGGMLAYDNACLVFADLIKGSGAFNGYRGEAPSPPYDAQGWPTRVDAKTGTTNLVVALNANLPTGEYTLNAKGIGKIMLSGGFDGQNWRTVEFNGDGRPRKVRLAKGGVPWGNQITLVVLESNVKDHLRDLSFVLPGHVGRTFYQGYLNDLKPFSVLRTMDWQATNGSKLVEWSTREKIRAKFSMAQRGRVDEEYAIELANLLHKDLWICIPALASDDYIRRLAELFDRGLEPGRTIYVEYSNELWNTFPQAGQLQAEQKKRPQFPTEVPAHPGKPAAPLAGGWEYAARRDGHATNLFKASLPPSRPCVRVIARQAGYPTTITLAIKQYKADGYGFDAISAAAYFYAKGVDLGKATKLHKTDPIAAVTQVVKGLDASIVEYTGYLAWYKTQADANKVPLVIYEGGQHLASLDASTTPLLMAVNRDPRMGQAYAKLIDALPATVGPICWYNDCGTWTKWGYWGLKERTGQPPKSAHKYRAVLESIAKSATPTVSHGSSPAATGP